MCVAWVEQHLCSGARRVDLLLLLSGGRFWWFALVRVVVDFSWCVMFVFRIGWLSFCCVCVGESLAAPVTSAIGGGGHRVDKAGRQGTDIGESMCIFMCLGKTIVKHLLLWGSFGRVSHFLPHIWRCHLTCWPCTIWRLEYCFSLDLVAPVLIYFYLFSFKTFRV